MFAQLIEFFEDWWARLTPFFVLDPFEAGVVLRLGKYTRTVGEGFHWKIPLVEEVMYDTVVRSTSYLDVQSLTSRDGKAINISPIIIYKIHNIKRFLLEVDDAEEAVCDVVYGIVDEEVTHADWAFIRTPEFVKKVYKHARKEGLNWGVTVLEIKFSDRSAGRAIRLWTGTE